MKWVCLLFHDGNVVRHSPANNENFFITRPNLMCFLSEALDFKYLHTSRTKHFSTRGPILCVNEKPVGQIWCCWLWECCYGNGRLVCLGPPGSIRGIPEVCADPFVKRVQCNKSPGCSLWRMLLYETGQNSKRYAYKPDVGGNFLCLTWFNHLIDSSSESGVKLLDLLQILAYGVQTWAFALAQRGTKMKLVHVGSGHCSYSCKWIIMLWLWLFKISI